MDIIDRLQRLMHAESAAMSPRTTETIEAMREAQAEIERLTGALDTCRELRVFDAAEIKRRRELLASRRRQALDSMVAEAQRLKLP